jgi:hypothetical protein
MDRDPLGYEKRGETISDFIILSRASLLKTMPEDGLEKCGSNDVASSFNAESSIALRNAKIRAYSSSIVANQAALSDPLIHSRWLRNFVLCTSTSDGKMRQVSCLLNALRQLRHPPLS